MVWFILAILIKWYLLSDCKVAAEQNLRVMHRMQPPSLWMRKKKEASWHIVFKYCTCCWHTRYASFVSYTRCEWSQQISACLKFTSHIDELPFIRCCRSCKMNKKKREIQKFLGTIFSRCIWTSRFATEARQLFSIADLSAERTEYNQAKS